MATSPSNPNSQSGGYPIGALFVLVTLGAVLTAAVTPQIRELGRDEADVRAAIAGSVLGGLGGLALGGILGMLSQRWVRGFFLGAASGLVLGVVAGLICTTPIKHIPRIAAAMIVGSAIIVIVAYVMRRRE